LQPILRFRIPHFWGKRGPDSKVEELQLVQGLRERREEMVAIFLERYRSLFYHCISHFEPDASSRDDLYQDVILYVLHRLDADSFDPSKGSLGTWLYRVAWCRCVDLKRKQSSQRNPRLTAVGENLPDKVDHSPTPGEQAGEEEIGSLVRRGMASLEPEERALLELRFVDGCTMHEIAERLEISLEQTKYRLKRASTSLRRVLLNDLAFEEAG
jgi:RNA polymerase sigma-70 factor (ECF subfamily)